MRFFGVWFEKLLQVVTRVLLGELAKQWQQSRFQSVLQQRLLWCRLQDAFCNRESSKKNTVNNENTGCPPFGPIMEGNAPVMQAFYFACFEGFG